jgi:hypothetical protein
MSSAATLKDAFDTFERRLEERIEKVSAGSMGEGRSRGRIKKEPSEEAYEKLLIEMRSHRELKGSKNEQLDAKAYLQHMKRLQDAELDEAIEAFKQFQATEEPEVLAPAVALDEEEEDKEEDDVDYLVLLANEFDALQNTFAGIIARPTKPGGVNDPRSVAQQLTNQLNGHFTKIGEMVNKLPDADVTAAEQYENIRALKKQDAEVTEKLRKTLEEAETLFKQVETIKEGIRNRRLARRYP